MRNHTDRLIWNRTAFILLCLVYSLSTKSSRLIHVVTCVSELPPSVRLITSHHTDSPSAHPRSMNIWVVSTIWLLRICCCEHGDTPAWVPAVRSFEYTPPVSRAGSRGNSELMLWRTSTLFSMAAAPFYVPTNSSQGFQRLHILVKSCRFLFVWKEPS